MHDITLEIKWQNFSTKITKSNMVLYYPVWCPKKYCYIIYKSKSKSPPSEKLVIIKIIKRSALLREMLDKNAIPMKVTAIDPPPPTKMIPEDQFDYHTVTILLIKEKRKRKIDIVNPEVTIYAQRS